MIADEARAVLDFWFGELSAADWWKKDPAQDERIRQRFGTLHARASRCELWAWRAAADGRLAEIIVLDQFSRNLFRDSARAFAQDPLALALAQEAVAGGFDRALDPERRVFMYMPYMHSESRIIHETAEVLFRENGITSNYDFELRHKRIVDQFGRYPHRNAVLGRETTPEEAEFLKMPGSSF